MDAGLLNERGELLLTSQVWPETGALGAYPRWASKTTDATMAYHFACGIPVFAHLVNRFGLRNHLGQPFRFQHILVGKSAASKSTAWRRAAGVYDAVCERLGIPLDPGTATISGSLPGLFELLGELKDPDSEWHYGLLWHEEISTFLRNTRNEAVAEFLCMLADGVKYERHLRYVKAQNKLAPGSAVESVDNHAFQGVYVTTFDVIRTITRPEYINGGAFSRWAWFVGPERPHHAMTYAEHLDEREAVVEAFAEVLQWVRGKSVAYSDHGLPFQVVMPSELRDEAIRPLYEELLDEPNDAMVCLQKRGLELIGQYAALFAISDCRLEVDEVDLRRARNLVAYSCDGYRRLLPRIGAVGRNTIDVVHGKINDAFEAIRQAGDRGLSRSDLHRVLSRPGKAVIDEIVATLIDEGVIEEQLVRCTNNDGTPSRGRPSKRYVVTTHARTV